MGRISDSVLAAGCRRIKALRQELGFLSASNNIRLLVFSYSSWNFCLLISERRSVCCSSSIANLPSKMNGQTRLQAISGLGVEDGVVLASRCADAVRLACCLKAVLKSSSQMRFTPRIQLRHLDPHLLIFSSLRTSSVNRRSACNSTKYARMVQNITVD